MLRVTLHEDGKRFQAVGGHPDGGDKINEIVANWPGWRRNSNRHDKSVYTGPRSTVSALALSSTTIQLEWDSLAQITCQNLLESFRNMRRLLADHKSIRIGSYAFAQHLTSRKPHTFQAAGVAAMAQLGGRCLLSDEMGLGKTAQSLWLASELCVSRILIVCPASVKWNWPKEVQETLGGLWPVQVIDGSARKRANQFSELDAFWQKHRRLVIVINYELLKWITDDQMARLMKFVDGQMCILDESHYVKNQNADRTRIVRVAFCPEIGGARYRVAISGTPVWNTIEDLFSQIELVRPGTFHSLHWFLNRYTNQSLITVGGARKIKKSVVRSAKNERELNLILNTLQIRRKKSEVTDLPPKVFTYPELELDAHTAKIYAAMRDFALLLLEKEDETLPILSPTAKTAVEAAARCAQIAQGCVGGIPEELMRSLSGILSTHAERVPGKEGWLVFPKSAKILWLLEQLDAIEKQEGRSVVFSQYNAPLIWLSHRRGGQTITGDVQSRKRQDVFDAFQAGQIQELYIQVRIAQGFNLHRSQDVLFLGRDWAFAPNDQATDRVHRIGQTGTVNVQMPFVRKTIEVRQHQALAEKARNAEDVLCFRTIADLKAALA